MKIENKCICEHSTGSTHIECCNICGLPLQKEQWYFYLPDENSNQVQAGVMPKPEILYPALRYIFDLTYEQTPDLSIAISQLASIRAIALRATEYAELPDNVKKYWERIKERFSA